jgi:DNA/RNA-binding protein KIN17
MEVLMEQEEKRKQAMLRSEDSNQRTDYWLRPGIVVKVMSKTLADGKYYKAKGGPCASAPGHRA